LFGAVDLLEFLRDYFLSGDVFLLHFSKITEKVKRLGFVIVVVKHDLEVIKAEFLVKEVLLVLV